MSWIRGKHGKLIRFPDPARKALQDQVPVRVTSPTGAAWEGTVVGIHDEPVMLLKMQGGRRVVLPLRFKIERL